MSFYFKLFTLCVSRYKLLHPSEAYRNGSDLIVNDAFERVLEEEEEEVEGQGSDDEISSDEEESRKSAKREARQERKAKRALVKKTKKASKGPKMFELGENRTYVDIFYLDIPIVSPRFFLLFSLFRYSFPFK